MIEEKEGFQRCVKCKCLHPNYYDFVDGICFHCRFKEKYPHHFFQLKFLEKEE